MKKAISIICIAAYCCIITALISTAERATYLVIAATPEGWNNVTSRTVFVSSMQSLPKFNSWSSEKILGTANSTSFIKGGEQRYIFCDSKKNIMGDLGQDMVAYYVSALATNLIDTNNWTMSVPVFPQNPVQWLQQQGITNRYISDDLN